MYESSVADFGIYQLTAHEQRIPNCSGTEEVGKFDVFFFFLNKASRLDYIL